MQISSYAGLLLSGAGDERRQPSRRKSLVLLAGRLPMALLFLYVGISQARGCQMAACGSVERGRASICAAAVGRRVCVSTSRLLTPVTGPSHLHTLTSADAWRMCGRDPPVTCLQLQRVIARDFILVNHLPHSKLWERDGHDNNWLVRSAAPSCILAW